mmetsp:Transcript_20432/g.64347  ORF Transcript_20432/g.64347 Transcript_20432/m.64347 type:complete len:205 (+) Transcript_20432:301-915(+)
MRGCLKAACSAQMCCFGCWELRLAMWAMEPLAGPPPRAHPGWWSSALRAGSAGPACWKAMQRSGGSEWTSMTTPQTDRSTTLTVPMAVTRCPCSGHGRDCGRGCALAHSSSWARLWRRLPCGGSTPWTSSLSMQTTLKLQLQLTWPLGRRMSDLVEWWLGMITVARSPASFVQCMLRCPGGLHSTLLLTWSSGGVHLKVTRVGL